jgi:hypothetical protein
MVRHVLATLAALVVVPAVASAQAAPLPDTDRWGPTLRITPYVGFAPMFTRIEDRLTYHGDAAEFGRVEVEHPGGLTLGLDADYRVHRALGVALGAGFTTRGRNLEFSHAEDEVFEAAGSDFVFARAVATLRLQEPESELQLRRLSAALFAGPVLMREIPAADIGRGTGDGMNLLGFGFGGGGEIPLAGPNLLLHVGIDNNVIWWDTTELARRVDAVNAAFGLETWTEIETNVSHLWVLRAGLTFRLW